MCSIPPLRLAATRKPALAGLRERWVEPPEVHQLHVDAVDIPKAVLSRDPEIPPKAAQRLAQLFDLRAALPWRVAAVPQIHVESKDQLIAHPVGISSPQLDDVEAARVTN